MRPFTAISVMPQPSPFTMDTTRRKSGAAMIQFGNFTTLRTARLPPRTHERAGRRAVLVRLHMPGPGLPDG
jgi:hypothetical protein